MSPLDPRRREAIERAVKQADPLVRRVLEIREVPAAAAPPDWTQAALLSWTAQGRAQQFDSHQVR